MSLACAAGWDSTIALRNPIKSTGRPSAGWGQSNESANLDAKNPSITLAVELRSTRRWARDLIELFSIP
jgi:hypothetical protein